MTRLLIVSLCKFQINVVGGCGCFEVSGGRASSDDAVKDGWMDVELKIALWPGVLGNLHYIIR